MTDSATSLLRCLSSFFTHPELENIRSRSWASATFAGVRHEISIRLTGDTAEDEAAAFQTNLGERDFALRGHILADIALISRQSDGDGIRLQLEALTLEDC